MSMSTSWLILDELATWHFRGSERGASSTKSLSIATSTQPIAGDGEHRHTPALHGLGDLHHLLGIARV